MMTIFSKRLRHAAWALALAATAGLAQAGTVSVRVDTTGFGAPGGFLAFEFSGGSGVAVSTALMSKLSGFDAAKGVYLDGAVTPQGGGYLFSNAGTGVNYLELEADFDRGYAFDLTFGGDADPSGAFIASFSIKAYDASGTWLGNYHPDNYTLAEYLWTPPSVPGAAGGIAALVSDPGAVATVPEPGQGVLMAAGLAALALTARRRRGGKAAMPLAA